MEKTLSYKYNVLSLINSVDHTLLLLLDFGGGGGVV